MSGQTEKASWGEPTLFAGDSPARIYPSPGEGPGSPGKDLASSGTRSLSRRMSKRDGSSWRTSPDFSHLIREETSPLSSLHWPTQGLVTLNGECWTRSSSESPNAAAESSLSQVLTPRPEARYLLSGKAAAGILARSERRGKTLQEPLRAALLSAIRRDSISRPASEPGPLSEPTGGGTPLP